MRAQQPSMPSTVEAFVAAHRDPAEFELALRPWELLCRPTRAGDFLHRISGIRSSQFILYREHFSLPTHSQGLTPEGMLVLGVPLGHNDEPLYWGRGRPAGTVPASLPGPLEARLSEGHVQLIALVSVQYLRQVMTDESCERLFEAAGSRFLQLDPRIIGAFTRWGCELLDAVESRPAAFNTPAASEKILQELTCHLVRISAKLPPERPISRLQIRQLGLSRALEYLRHRHDSSPSVEELCQVARVSERTLRYAFCEEYGLSPTEFMLRRRLHAVRQDLNASDARHTTVSEVATRYGFTELGRFSAQYRRLFGALPSRSLRTRR